MSGTQSGILGAKAMFVSPNGANAIFLVNGAVMEPGEFTSFRRNETE